MYPTLQQRKKVQIKGKEKKEKKKGAMNGDVENFFDNDHSGFNRFPRLFLALNVNNKKKKKIIGKFD